MILCEPQEGQRDAQEAIRLSPIDPLRYAMVATDALNHAMLGDEATAALLADRAAREPRAHVLIAAIAGVCQVWVRDEAGANYWGRQVKARAPNLTAGDFFQSFPFEQGRLREQIASGLNAIGISI
jgi:hypothetical protein